MKILSIIFLVLTSLLLLLYPLVLMANLMAVASIPATPDAENTSFFSLHAYLWASTLYPIPWLAATIGSIWSLWKKKNAKKALLWQAGLAGYIVLSVALLFAS